jgi:5'-nucleotidase
MTGDQIRRAIEDSMNFFLEPALGGGAGSYAFAAGLRYDIDYTAPFGSRITNLEVNRRLEETWRPIDLTATYTVVTNDFIATPRDGYFTFAEIDKNDPDQYVNTFVLYAQSLIDYVKDLRVISDPPLSEYSTQKITFSDGSTYSARSP